MTASKKSIGSDLAKVDAYVNTAADYKELPEITDEEFARAVVHHNRVPVRMGRPPSGDRSKQQVTLRLDPEVIEQFKATGAGWQTRMNRFLSTNATVLRMIEDYEEAITSAEKMLVQLRDGGMRPVHATAEKTVAQVETSISHSKETIRGLREQLRIE